MGGKIKKIYHKLKHKKIKTWILVLILVPLSFADVTLLRQNHIRMTELRDYAIQTDAKIANEMSDEEVAQVNEELAAALVELKEFMYANIVVNVVENNGVQRVTFGTGPFYLEHSYIRDASRALAAAEANMTSDNNPYGNIYAEASAVCRPEAIANGWAWNNINYINCMMGEINKYPAAAEIQDTMTANLPSTELYRRDYASPAWTPSFTGFMLVITGLIVVVIFIRIIVWLVLRLSLLFI